MSAPSTPPGKSLAELAVEAIGVQDACNLSGVVLSFGRVVVRLRELLPESTSTRDINQHPIAQAWADKIASLAGVQWGREWSLDAYREIARLAGLCVPPGEQPADHEVEDLIHERCAECPPEHMIPDSGEQPDDRLSQCVECGGGSSDPDDVHTCPQGPWGEGAEVST
jgi:hypothetical protein